MKGKFRDAEFLVTSDDLTFGRRNQVHEYPLRDDPYVEDIGKKAREFSIQVTVIGQKYEKARDKLIAALEKPGTGTLVHPYYGTMKASVISARKSESIGEKGKATFHITFVPGEGTPRYPTTATDTASLVDAAAGLSIADAISDFADNFSVVGLIDDYVTELTSDLDEILGSIEDAVDSVTDPIASLIRAPAEMAAAIAGSINNVRNSLADPLRALAIYDSLSSADVTASSTSPGTTPGRQQQAASRSALVALVQRVAVIEGVRSSSQIDYSTADEAEKVSQQRQALIEQQQINNGTQSDINDDLYQSLRTLRTAMVTDLRIRGARLPKIRSIQLDANQPAIVLAHQLYENVDRANEIVSQNNVRHPGFVPGGQKLEVLTTDGLISRSAGRTGGTQNV